jgi:colicin import membrane protein
MKKKYFVFSLIFHVIILFALIFSFNFAVPLPVIQNTNQKDVISAVLLGDVEQSKILPKQSTPPPPIVQSKNNPPSKPQPVIEKKAIILQVDKKKTVAKKILQQKWQQDLLAKNLLDDITKIKKQQKQVKQKQLQKQFQKHLREQAEKSLRQQLLNEEIKLKSTEARQSQGEINKYKALILQAISENWLVPPQADKSLYCELMIRVAPGGMVLDVEVTKTSGDPALDRSARAAVLKASPLPVPTEPNAFDAFRQFVLKVKPENIMTT